MKFQAVRSVARNAGLMTGARVIGPVLQAGYVVLLAAYLGPELFGLLSYSRSWYLALLPLTLLGLGPILAREIGRHRGQAADIAGRAFTLRVLATALTALVCASLGWVLETNPTVQTLISIYSFALAARAICIFAEQVFVAFESSGHILRQEALFRPIEVGLGCTVVVLGGGVLGVALVHITIWGLQAVRGLYLVQTRLVTVHFEWSWSPLGRMLREGIPIGLASICSVWLMQGPLVLYRQVAVSEAALGQMALTIQILGLVLLVPLSVAGVALPVISRAVARGDGKDTIFVGGMCRLALIFGAAAALTGTALGAWIVELLFGHGFEGASQLFGPVLWLLIPLSVGHAAQTVLFARGLYVPAVICATTGAAILTGAIFVLVPAVGPLGVVLAVGIGSGIWAMGSVALVARGGALDLSRTFARPAGTVALALGAYLLFEPLGPWLGLAAGLAALAGGIILLGVLRPSERAVVFDLVGRLRTSRPSRSSGGQGSPDS
jgi:O-antigen/teichoic acid export membrane protein